MARLTNLVVAALLSLGAVARPSGGPFGKDTHIVNLDKRNGNQSIVSWDDHSLFVKGERIHYWSGEYHPFRMASPGLWLDIFQKIKALGYNGVSFYVDWALLEGQPGVYRESGIFDLQPFMDAALQAGIYLLARPGPYINAEVSGGGFPGWLQTINGHLRTDDSAFINSQKLYLSGVLSSIAKGQITNGGPVIMVQVENEYTSAVSGIKYPDYPYMETLEQMFIDNGIVVPLSFNDASESGHFAPGTPSQVDIYGYDSYPLGFNCGNPYTWGSTSLPTYFYSTHVQQDPSAPHFIVEFQAGSFDPWGGYGFDMCTELLGPEFERLFYKNNIASGITMINYYMTYGGTNWGNLGYPVGYTSYDYGAAIKEDRTVARQKYSEAKLIANFVQCSPALLTAVPGALSTTLYTTTTNVAITPLMKAADVESNSATQFFVARQSTYNSLSTVNYKLILPTSRGNITVPQLGGDLTIIGRDSKIHVVDYPVGGHTILYSSAEIFTWARNPGNSKTVLILYGEISETHEIAFKGELDVLVIENAGIQSETANHTTILNWQVSPERNVAKIGNNLFVYMVPRQQAYNWWTLPISSKDATVTPSSADNAPTLIAGGGYLLRNVTVTGKSMALIGDLNATVPLEIPLGAPANLHSLTFNGKAVQFSQNPFGIVTANLEYTAPTVNLPNLMDLTWKYHDTLPEIQPTYDDSMWVSASKVNTSNIDVTLATPTSLLSSDYGFNTGSLLFRGHFTAFGNETGGSITVSGGEGFGFNLWLNSTLVGTYHGSGGTPQSGISFTLPTLAAGANYVLTLLQDFTGYEENFQAGDTPSDPNMKTPRGIISYSLTNRAASDVTWKIQGNLGGENYTDITRGPLNEGAMYAERQGWHQPAPPTSNWTTSSPAVGLNTSGVGFYATSFSLDLPQGYDIPLSFVFNQTTSPVNYRCQLYVNGYQFGKYVNNIGPQTSFPVPEGIINHQGTNYVALTLWANDDLGANLSGFSLQADAVIQSGYGKVLPAPQPAWTQRPGAH